MRLAALGPRGREGVGRVPLASDLPWKVNGAGVGGGGVKADWVLVLGCKTHSSLERVALVWKI